jgi:hypothetical protein
MVGLSASAIANGYAVGAALLALWLFIRYPNRGPQTFRTAGAVVFSSVRTIPGPIIADTAPLRSESRSADTRQAWSSSSRFSIRTAAFTKRSTTRSE